MAKKRKSTARIYYGMSKDKKQRLYWTVEVTDAKKSVKVSGSLLHAMRGAPGLSIGCHLSNCVTANQRVFPHPCILAYFTRCALLIVTKIKGGQPSHAVRYHHRYGFLVDLNDKQPSKEFIKLHPDIADRDFTLSKPKKQAYRPGRGPGVHTGERRPFLPRGALRRAQESGLITADFTSQNITAE